jgi:hypothetical protein
MRLGILLLRTVEKRVRAMHTRALVTGLIGELLGCVTDVRDCCGDGFH